MTLPELLPDVRRAVMSFDASALPVALADKLNAARAESSPVLMLATVAEVIYANRALATADAMRLGAQCAHFGRMFALMHLRDPRGLSMFQALMRDAGEAAPEGASWPAAEADPEADASLVLTPVAPPTPPGA